MGLSTGFAVRDRPTTCTKKHSSILCLANNTGVTEVFDKIDERFSRLYKRKVYVHHYTQYIEESEFGAAIGGVRRLSERYRELEVQPATPTSLNYYHLVV